MYRKQVRRRRAVLVALIVVSLVLISTSFSESRSGPLHTVQEGVSAVLSPLEEGAERALKPGRDLINWFEETFAARGENEDLREQLAELRGELADAQDQIGDDAQFRKLLGLPERAPAIGEFDAVTARVIARSPTVWFATVTVDQGTGAGVAVNDAVVSGDGLIGRVREVTRGSSVIELITDQDNAVSAKVLPDGPSGIIEPEVGDPDDLLLDFIENEESIQEGQMLVTAGWSNGQISSAYPPDIPIGLVAETEIGEQDSFQRIHVRPYADLRQLEFVQVLTGGPERPGVPG